MKKFRFVVLLTLSIFTAVLFSGCQNRLFDDRRIFPEEGVWYCEELQITLNFEKNATSKAIVNGEEIECVAGFMSGSTTITVSCQDFNTELMHMGEIIFPGEYVSSSDIELLLRHQYSKEVYTFVRIE